MKELRNDAIGCYAIKTNMHGIVLLSPNSFAIAYCRCNLVTAKKIPKTIKLPIINNFQLNEPSGETLKLWVLH